jgi:hypothetical protein
MEHKPYEKQTQHQASEALDQARTHTAEMVRSATESGSSFIENQRRLAAAEVDGYACALHETARQLHEQSQDRVAGYTERLADGLDDFARNLRERDLRDGFDRLTDFARRQPMLFLGGAVAAGFAFTRFLKSTADGGHESPRTSEMAAEVKEKLATGKEKVRETIHEKSTEVREKSDEAPHGRTSPTTAAEAEIPVILKPHEPAHPGSHAPNP